MVTWYSVDTAPEQERFLAAWGNNDAPIENLETCAMLLEVARDQVIAYGPAPAPLVEGEPVPDPPVRFVYAQLMQAKNLHNAGTVTSSGDLGEGGFTFTPRPLDKTIRQIIRPVNGRPHVL